jgi:AraC family transcriptional regulator of adaptative response/methylated-DNA-[protein]-cysteine methyltransferase
MTNNDLHRDYERVARAIKFITTNRRAQPSLDDVARAIGVSPFHAQRIFQRWAGVSPKRFLQFLTARDAFTLLRDEQQPVLATAYDLGLSGPSRLHDLMVAVDAVTPGTVQSAGAGLAVRWGVHDTPYGAALVGRSDRGLCWFGFVTTPEQHGDSTLRQRWPHATITHDPAVTAPLVQRMFGEADPAAPPLPLHLRGTNFQVKVWEALLRVPPGRLTTYAEVAQAVGEPTAHRAVGAAVGRNPLGYVVPCHRVIRASGAIGDYHWGATRKQAILAQELLREA